MTGIRPVAGSAAGPTAGPVAGPVAATAAGTVAAGSRVAAGATTAGSDRVPDGTATGTATVAGATLAGSGAASGTVSGAASGAGAAAAVTPATDPAPAPPQPPPLRALVVEDEAVTRQELADLLAELPGIGPVHEAGSGEDAIRMIGNEPYDAVFLDISMPGLDGMDIARLLHRLSDPPAIVFVTASDRHAVEAFGIGAVDYLLKPIRPERLAESAARVRTLRRPDSGRAAPPAATGTSVADDSDPATPQDGRAADDLPVVQIETGRQTVFVRRDDIQYAEAHGDYVRLYTEHDSHLIRLSLSYLETIWEPAGFVRAHRGYLVNVGWVRDLRLTSSAGMLAGTPAGDVPVSRRHARDVKDRLLTAARDDPR